jgi:hypothetical protein
MRKIVIVTRSTVLVDERDHETMVSIRRLAAKDLIKNDTRATTEVTITEDDGTITKLKSVSKRRKVQTHAKENSES